jgi:hypothetical protein
VLAGKSLGAGNSLRGGEADLVVGALLGKILGKGAHAGAVFGGRQQDVGAPRWRRQQQAREQQAAAPKP